MSGAPAPSLDGRRFAAVGEVEGGEVGADTVFRYHEAGAEVWAEYAGGEIRFGTLVGTRRGDELDFRYAQLNTAGQTATGHCRSRISLLDDGRLRLDETWEWESREGSGTSAVVELPPASAGRVTFEDAKAALAAQGGGRLAAVLSERDVEVELHAPVGRDPQAPHERDALYVVVAGSGTLQCAGDRMRFAPHDVLYVPAGADHGFTEHDDLVVWVAFLGRRRGVG